MEVMNSSLLTVTPMLVGTPIQMILNHNPDTYLFSMVQQLAGGVQSKALWRDLQLNRNTWLLRRLHKKRYVGQSSLQSWVWFLVRWTQCLSTVIVVAQ